MVGKVQRMETQSVSERTDVTAEGVKIATHVHTVHKL